MRRNYVLLLMSMLFVNSLYASAFGTQIGTFNGIAAYSNGSISNESGVYNTSAGVNTGIKWQCVEYVNRYYYMMYGINIKSTGTYGNANHYYNNASFAGLSAYPNGGSIKPQVGDIICSNGGKYGHVAIIREIGSNYIKIIQQNWSNDSNDENKTLTLTNNTVGDFGSGYPVQGWVRATQISPSCTFNVSANNAAQISLTQGWKFWQVTNSTFYHVFGNVSNLSNGSQYAIYLADENGNPLILIMNKLSTTTFDFYFGVPSNYNDGGKYTFIFCPQGSGNTFWTKSAWFYLSALPTLSISINTKSLAIGQKATVSWHVNGGISSLTDRGWTNNIQIQWYQNENPLINLAQVPIANQTYTFTVPSSIAGGVVPGCQFKISGSNPANTSIPDGYVSSFTSDFCIQNSVGINDVNDNSKIKIFPNPAKDVVTIETSDVLKEVAIEICDMNGRVLMNKQIKDKDTHINISNLPNGMYFVKLLMDTGIVVRKLIKE